MKSSVLAAIFLTLACNAQAADLHTDIAHANQAFVTALNKGDAASVAALYTDDATILPPDSDLVSGRSGILAFWQHAVDGGLKLSPFQIVSLQPLGNNAAREIGRTAIAGKEPVSLKYVVVWRRVRGAWRLSTDIWNVTK